MSSCLVGLGSNLGDRHSAISQAIQLIDQHPQVELVIASRLYATQPIGGPAGQPDFVNAVAKLETSLQPAELLAHLFRIEDQLGRQRKLRWQARRLDLDLLLYGAQVLSTASLEVPHPRMAYRRFVLVPAAQIAPQMIHPTSGWTVQQLLDHLNTAPDYVAITGSSGPDKTRLAQSAGTLSRVRLLADPVTTAAHYRAGLDLTAQLEFLGQRSRRIQAGLGSQRQENVTCVSDYWLGESEIYARLTLPADEQVLWRAHFDQLGLEQLRPKLLVYLRPPASGVHVQARSELARRFDEELAKQIRRCPGAPVLSVSADDPSWAGTEITAAIQAIRPESRNFCVRVCDPDEPSP